MDVAAQANADPRGGLDPSAGNQLKEASKTRLLLFESAPPGIKTGWFDPGISTIGGNTHTACRLVLYDGAPMGPSFRSGHLLPPNNENFSLLGSSIAQRRMPEKMGWSNAYDNIWLVHKKINAMKGTMTYAEFIVACQSVLDHRAATCALLERIREGGIAPRSKNEFDLWVEKNCEKDGRLKSEQSAAGDA